MEGFEKHVGSGMNRTWRLIRLEASGRKRILGCKQQKISYLNKREFTLLKGSQEFTASTRRNRLKIGKN